VAIIIKKKVGTSNKNQTLPKTSHPTPIAASFDAAPAQSVPQPFIDKISIVMEPSEQIAHDMFIAMTETFNDSTVFKEAGSGAKLKGYTYKKRIALKSVVGAKKWPLLHIGYDGQKKLVLKARLEFVPVDLKSVGMSELHLALTEIVEDGWHEFVKRGRITRIDVAVDLPHATMDSFLYLPPQSISVMQWKSKGQLQTATYGKKQGNQTLIYDRGAKRAAKNQGWKNITGIRVERRLVGMKMFELSKLAELPNPFASMKLIETMAPPPAIDQTAEGKVDWRWVMFCDSVQVRGLSGALALLPKERAQTYKKHLAAHQKSWWQPEQIWNHWPSNSEMFLSLK